MWTDLKIREVVHRGARCTVYRATRLTDERRVILKVLRTDCDDAVNRARLEHEFTLASLVASPSVVKPYGMTTHEGRLALALEDFDGDSLARALPRRPPTVLGLRIARGIAVALAAVHRAGVVHRDVKPANLIFRAAPFELKITDFGIARARRGTQAARPAEQGSSGQTFEGTLPYMAPEQSGRLQRATDWRADLYSFGVVLYELFTGELPFRGSDALEWMHAHAAQVPRPLVQLVPSVPEMVSRLVLKLLAKAPEERYQSAEGVLRDLTRCEEALAAGGTIPLFAPGDDDRSAEFHLPSKVYGRDRELAAMRAAVERVADAGRTEVLLLSGQSGIGKTSLVRELEGSIARRNGHFATGKFDQYRRHVPYSAVVQAGSALASQLLAASGERLATFRSTLLESLDGNGQVLTALFPAVERILGPQPAVQDLPASGMQNRLHHAARAFLRAFEVPVVLAFDDLQWADIASLDLLEALLAHGTQVPLLAVLSYRDQEVSLSHPLTTVIEKVRAAGTPVGTVQLGPLDDGGVRALVRDTLQTDGEAADELSALALAKTAGNPFFVREFLRTLHLDGLLRFDEGERRWTFDRREVVARRMTDNVVELMMDRLQELPPASCEALRVAAFLGDEFDLDELAAALGVPRPEVVASLGPPFEQGLVSEEASGAEARGASGPVRRARFGHDRIQQAAYDLTKEHEKAAEHLKVGRLLWQRLESEASAVRLFEVANHLDAAFERVTDDGERERLLALFLSAARRARGATAYLQARTYLARAAELLSEAGWESRFALTFDLHVDLAECDYLAGRLDPARALFADLLRRARTDLERARVYYLQIHLFQVVGDFAEAAALSVRSFALFGLHAPETDEEAARVVDEQHREVRALLGDRPIAARVTDPPMTDPRMRMLVDLLEASGPPLYMVRPALFPWVALELVRHSLRYGNAEASCYGYGIYALLRAAVLGDVEGGYAFSQLAIHLNQKLGAVKLEGCMLHLLGDHVNFWKNPIATDLPILERGFLACVRGGDNIYSNYIGFQAPWHLYESGAKLAQVVGLTEKYETFARETNYLPVAWTLQAERQFARTLMGATADPGGAGDEEALFEVSKARFGCGIVYVHVLRLIARYTFGDYPGALRAAEAALPELGSAFSMPMYVSFSLYQALTMAALYEGADEATRARYLETMTAQQAAMAGWARGCPANFASKAALLRAEIARVTGDPREALRSFEEARLGARTQGFVQYEALACELAAPLYQAIGVDWVKRALLADAYALYRRWGAAGKASALLGRHRGIETGLGVKSLAFAPGSGPLETNVPATLDAKATTVGTTQTSSAGELDLTSVLKASQSLSAEMRLPRLLPRLMAIVIEYAGAVRGSLLLVERDGLVVAAEAAVDLPVDAPSAGFAPDPAPSAARTVEVPRAVNDLPSSVLRYVQRTAEPVLVEDASTSNRFGSDPYFQEGVHRSVLCKPVAHQGRLIGMFYLENALVAGAFSPKRLAILEVLASQTAISIENSRLYEASQAAVSARDEFLSIASHELKTPMAPLALQVHRLTAAIRKGTLRGMSDDALNKLASTCDAQINRLSRLVTALLDVSRIESGRMTLQTEQVDLGALVSEAVERHAGESSAAGCMVSLALDEEVVGTWDRMRMEQVLSNLLLNATKFGRGRPIEVSVRRTRGDSARVAVRDHGVGVRDQDRERIFQRFERVQSLTNVDGLGLGLFIVDAIVQAHGGRVDVTHTPGGGATFEVTLPLGEAAPCSHGAY